MSDPSRVSTDYVADVVDEIALEGLDGITAEALWKRLSIRPNFCFQIDENSKNFLWKIVTRLADVKFYELPKARAELKHYNHLTADNTQSTALELDEIYPYSSIKNVTGIFGSCQYYKERVDVTNDVIKHSLKETDEKWGNKLVIVASQQIRSHALMGFFCSPNLDFTKMTTQYDILERIGRSRYLGVATCGKASLQSVAEDSKSIFHYLKFLSLHKLIKKQTLPGTTQVNPNVSRVYLTRFFEQCLNDNMTILQTAIEELKLRPNYLMPAEEFNALFDARKQNKLKKFKKSSIFRKYISVSKCLPYRTFFPDASQSEWERKSKGGERCVRCVQLLNPDVDIADLFEKECEVEDEDSPSGFLPRGIYYENMSLVAQAYHHIKTSGSLGLSQAELVLKMGLHKRMVRALVKRLINEKHCQFYIENDGRKRCKRIIVGENMQTKAAASELVQILSESGAAPKVASDHNDTDENGKESKPFISVEKLSLPQIQEDNMSYRTLRRIGMIIKSIKNNRFRLFHQITKYINEEEAKDGVTSKIDRITVQKLLQKLEKDQLIKVINVTGPDKIGNAIKVYTDPTFEPDEKQMENLYQTHSASSSNAEILKAGGDCQINLEQVFSTFLLENLSEMKKMTDGILQKSDKTNQPAPKGSELVYSPKFIRLNVLHNLIFYLVYEYTGIVNKSQEEMIEQLGKTTAVDEDLKREMPRLYGNQVSSYMFVPPLSHAGKLSGWFLISDILIRLPLSIIVKTLRVYETCPDLWKYLNHPIRMHYLVKDLPLSIRKILINRRSQLSYIYNELKRLCFMGLLQYGQKFGREHYQTFVYLNRKASLLDTTTSPPGYYHVPADVSFDVKSYNFITKNDVTNYWMDLFNICMGTNLGVKAHMIGKEISSERELAKESLKKYLVSKSVAKALEEDNGHLPGDHLGAAGIDSVMFSFLRSNWTGPINKTKDEAKKVKPVKIPFLTVRKEQVKKRLLLKKTHRRKGIIKTERMNNPSVGSEKPKMGKFRKVKEREIRFKRRKKIIYDEVDLEALKLMNTLRVTWSTAEDNFLLICRVAMLFLCPNVRTFVRIPWSEVRRVLQEHLPESKNKTQRAIARRIIYMLKNPTTVRSVNLCLEELKEMPEASEKFDCSELLSTIKPSTPNLTELQNKLYEKFGELVAFLKDRFVDNTNFNMKTDKDLIPDTLEEFLEKYQFEDSDESPLTVKSIRENVIRAIFMSSLSSRADKTSSAVQLFDIYRQYNEDELQNTVQKLHSDKVITISKKVGNTLFKSGKILPLTFAPYKLSFAFQTMLNTRYAHAIYAESFCQINMLQEKKCEEEFEVDLNECNIALFSLASKGFVFFRTIIPDQIIILDSGNVSDATYSKMLERYCEMLRFSGTNSKLVCSSGKIISRSEDGGTLEVTNDNEKGSPLAGDAGDDQEEEEEGVRAKRPRLIETEKAEMEEEVKKEVEKDEEKNSLGEKEVTEKEQLINKTSRSSRVILYMMREEAKKEASKEGNTGRKAQEFCVVNASKVLGKVDSNTLETYASERGPKAAAIIVKDIINRSTVPMALVDEDCFLQKASEKNELKGIREVLDFICSKKDLGATIKELTENFQESNLSLILRQLIDFKIVIKTGISETRLISQKYCTPWLLHSFKMTRLEREKIKPTDVTGVAIEKTPGNDVTSEEVPKKKMKGILSLDEIKSNDYIPPTCSTDLNSKIKVIVRPWIRIDGSLNRKVLDRFLGTVLAFVMTNPGISVRQIMNRFSPYITPVWTKDLIEILFDIGCVTLTSLVVTKKASLFSKSEVQVSDCYTGLEEDCFVAVEAKVDAVTILGLFIGKKTYSKDFLVD